MGHWKWRYWVFNLLHGVVDPLVIGNDHWVPPHGAVVLKIVVWEGTYRVDIWRDQWDRRSRKIFVSCVNFLEKQSEMLYNFNPEWFDKCSSLHILRKFVCYLKAKCVINIKAFTYCVNLCATKYVTIIQAYTYCENLCATFMQNVW